MTLEALPPNLLGGGAKIGQPSGLIGPTPRSRSLTRESCLCSPPLPFADHKVDWAHNLRSGYGVLLLELGGESPENRYQKPNSPKETGH